MLSKIRKYYFDKSHHQSSPKQTKENGKKSKYNSSEYQYYIAFYIIILRAESQHQYRNLFESYIIYSISIHLLSSWELSS